MSSPVVMLPTTMRWAPIQEIIRKEAYIDSIIAGVLKTLTLIAFMNMR